MKNRPKNLIIHHTLVSRDRNGEQFDAVNRYHVGKGWGKIGYHYFIEPDGTEKRGREDIEVGAHTKEKIMNYRSLGICLAGNFDIEEPTVDQIQTLSELLQRLQRRYNIPDKRVVPHRHYATYKSCWGRLLSNNIIGYIEDRLNKFSPASWAQEAWDFFIKNKVLSDKSDPHAALTYEKFAVLLKRYHERFNS